MLILVVRHALAVDKQTWKKSGRRDEDRPLTREGRVKFRKTAKGLAVAMPRVDTIATSPLARAAETAKILADVYEKAKRVEQPELAPDGDIDAAIRWFRAQKASASIAIVGHEPYLGRLVGALLTKHDRSFVDLRKGGACLIEFDGRAEVGRGRLAWLAKPSMLRALR